MNIIFEDEKIDVCCITETFITRRNIGTIFIKPSLTPEFKTRKQLIKQPLEYFTEVTDDDIVKIVMSLANSLSVLNAISCSLFKQVL